MTGSSIATVQLAVVSGSLTIAGVSKAWIAPGRRERTLLAGVWQQWRVRHGGPPRLPGGIWLAVAGTEVAVGAATLPSVTRPGALSIAVGLFTGAAGVSAWGMRAMPGATCGCFGGRARNSAWTVARAAWLAASAVACFLGGATTSPKGPVSRYLAVVACDALVLGASSEWVRTVVARWGWSVRRGAVRAITDSETRAATRALVDATPYWQALAAAGVVRMPVEPSRAWRQSGWLMLEFPGTVENGDALIVAGVNVEYWPAWCRIVIMAAREGEYACLAAWDSLMNAAQAGEQAATNAVAAGPLVRQGASETPGTAGA